MARSRCSLAPWNERQVHETASSQDTVLGWPRFIARLAAPILQGKAGAATVSGGESDEASVSRIARPIMSQVVESCWKPLQKPEAATDSGGDSAEISVSRVARCCWKHCGASRENSSLRLSQSTRSQVVGSWWKPLHKPENGCSGLTSSERAARPLRSRGLSQACAAVFVRDNGLLRNVSNRTRRLGSPIGPLVVCEVA